MTNSKHKSTCIKYILFAIYCLVIIIIGACSVILYLHHNEGHHINSPWKAGVPVAIQRNHIWLSNYFSKHVNSKQIYVKNVCSFSNKLGYNPHELIYNKNHQYMSTGANLSANAGMNPYYRKLSHNSYQLISGDKNIHRDLFDLHHINESNLPISVCYVKIINKHLIYLSSNHHLKPYHKITNRYLKQITNNINH